MARNSKLRLKRIVQTRGEASGQLKSPGDAVLIERGRPRWLLLSCPCGCGAEIPINLDPRAGPAWRLYKSAKVGFSVFPSVWRDSDCGSHFIIWRDSIFLFSWGDERFLPLGRAEEIETLSDVVRKQMPSTGFVSYVDIADSLGEVPWDVLDAFRHLVRKGIAQEGTGKQRGTFRRV